MTNLLSAIIPFLIGLITWGLALRRTIACVRGQRLLVSGIVFAEEILSIIVLYYLIKDSNLVGTIFYAIGGSLGAYLVSKPEETVKKEDK